MSHGLSKSKYVKFCQCPKMLWLKVNKPQEAVVDPSAQQLIKTGHEVGELAKGLYGNYVETTSYTEDGRLDLSAMIRKTQEYISKGEPVICEAAFSYNGNYCAVDILRKEKDGYCICEVKSSTAVKQEYILDVAYQKYVLEHCGLHIVDCYLVCLDSSYILNGKLDIHGLFAENYISGLVDEVFAEVENNIAEAHRVLDGDEPTLSIGLQCQKAGVCEFWQYCAKHLPKQSVFDIKGMRFATQVKYYEKGLITFDDLYHTSGLNDSASKVIEAEITDKTFLCKSEIHSFLKRLTYPIYFFDFETMMPAIPYIQGTHPYQQIPFQYSLHYQLEKGGELYHKEFLAEVGTDPLRSIAEAIVRDIPENVCVVAFNSAFEKTRLAELAEMFPDLASHLWNVHNHLDDLMIPFQQKWYYIKQMQGSYSIKYVLPALYPDAPDLDYHNLDEVHNGTEAMTIFPQLQYMSPEEQQRTRQNLLEYCKLDTYALYKVLLKLYELVK